MYVHKYVQVYVPMNYVLKQEEYVYHCLLSLSTLILKMGSIT